MKRLGIDTLFSLFLIILSVSFVVFGQGKLRSLEKQNRELSLRLSYAEEHPVIRYIHDSIPVTELKVVEVDRTDYKQQLADRELIKQLGLRVGELESENRQLLVNRDTVVLRPESGDSVLSYRDRWASFSFRVSEGELSYSVRDSLSTFVSCDYRHHFLWWRWGKRGYRVSVVSHNPHAVVEYEKYLKIK